MNLSKISIIRSLDRNTLIRLIHHIRKLNYKIWMEIVFDVYILSYKTKNVMYIAPRSLGTTSYFIKKICGEDVAIKKIKRIYVWELRRFVDRQDSVMIEIYSPFTDFFSFFGLYTSLANFVVPLFVTQVLDIEESLDDAIKINRRELKKVCKYSYEVSHDYGALKFFYEKLYVPHIKRKYGDSAALKFNSFEKILKNGELILVKLNGEYVSGGLSEMIGDIYYDRRNGVLDDFVKEGALLAAYYFSVVRAKQRNAKMVDFGGSRPFLSDGVLRHKTIWGARVRNDIIDERVIYLKNVLPDQPFIYIDNEKLKIAVFSENDKLIKEYAMLGLEFNVVARVDKPGQAILDNNNELEYQQSVQNL